MDDRHNVRARWIHLYQCFIHCFLSWNYVLFHYVYVCQFFFSSIDNNKSWTICLEFHKAQAEIFVCTRWVSARYNKRSEAKCLVFLFSEPFAICQGDILLDKAPSRYARNFLPVLYISIMYPCWKCWAYKSYHTMKSREATFSQRIVQILGTYKNDIIK